MATLYCPSCGGEFVDSVDTCPDCEVALVDTAPDVDETDATGEVAYDLADWSIEGRKLVDQLLVGTTLPGTLQADGAPGIPHAWEGATLVVPAVFEERVGALVDEAAAMVDGVDLGEDQVVYDLDALTGAQYSALYDELERLAITFALDEDGALVIGADDQEAVDAALDRIEASARTIGGYTNASHLLDGDGGDDGDGDDGEASDDAAEVAFGDEDIDGDILLANLGDVFVGADRLVHHPTDASAVLQFADGVAVLRRAALPFGYEPATWARILTTAGSLLELLESDEAVADEDISAAAHAVAELLRPLV